MKNNDTIKWRVGQLEKCVGMMDSKLDVILENHLPHLDSKVERLTWVAGLNLLAILSGIIVAILVK